MFKRSVNSLYFLIFLAILFPVSQARADRPIFKNWYAGAFGGYISGKLNSNDPSHEATTGNYDDDSPMAGIFAGYQHQFDENWIASTEIIIPLYIEKGTAVDKMFYPDLVTYEASYRYALFFVGKLGYKFGNAVPYLYGSAGFANVDGKTYNVDNDDNYSPGFIQSAAATHFVWQFGGGLDYNLSEVIFVGLRVAAFTGAQADHTMPWNEPGPNLFGYDALLLQANLGYRF